MKTFLTDYDGWAGPDIEAIDWEAAYDHLDMLIAFGDVHPDTRIVGEKVDGYDLDDITVGV